MFKIDLKFNGRALRPGALANSITKEVVEAARNHYKELLLRLGPCRQHGRYARLIGQGSSLELSACCKEQMDRATAALNSSK